MGGCVAEVKRRAAIALLYLQLNGAASVTSVSRGINENGLRTRYALNNLVRDGMAHVRSFDRVVGKDKIPRHVAQFAAGHGINAVLVSVSTRRRRKKLEHGSMRNLRATLDWGSTLHLQPIYVDWVKTRTPDSIFEEGQE